jgi:hypothetical protein
MLGERADDPVDEPRRIALVHLRTVALTLLFGMLVATGCSDEEETVPAACRQGPAAVRAALRDAPGRVTLDGTPLSACIKDTTAGGVLQEVGEGYLTAASDLADAALRDPNGPSAVQLGYLLGAYERSRAGAQGVGYELGRRLRSEVSRANLFSLAFRRGEQAGRRHG